MRSLKRTDTDREDCTISMLKKNKNILPDFFDHLLSPMRNKYINLNTLHQLQPGYSIDGIEFQLPKTDNLPANSSHL